MFRPPTGGAALALALISAACSSQRSDAAPADAGGRPDTLDTGGSFAARAGGALAGRAGDAPTAGGGASAGSDNAITTYDEWRAYCAMATPCPPALCMEQCGPVGAACITECVPGGCDRAAAERCPTPLCGLEDCPSGPRCSSATGPPGSGC